MDDQSKKKNEPEPGCSGLNKSPYNSGDYVIVKFSAKKTEYRIISKIDNDEGEMTVTLLIMTTAKLFKVVKIYTSDVPHTTKKLPTPSIILEGDRIFYEIKFFINIYEK